MFDAFMSVFCVLTMEIVEGVIPCVTNEGVRMCRAAHEEFVCEVVYELPHHCITAKDRHIHVVTLCTQTDIKYRLVVT